jgi:hypothetical protein
MATIVTTLDTRKLDALITGTDPRAGQIVKSTAINARGKAQTLCPVDTGYGKGTLHEEEKSTLTWWVIDGTDYLIYQELGFHHVHSGAFIQNPFMVPAVEWVRPQFTKAFRELLK